MKVAGNWNGLFIEAKLKIWQGISWEKANGRKHYTGQITFVLGTRSASEFQIF